VESEMSMVDLSSLNKGLYVLQIGQQKQQRFILVKQ
jgi:hypothetical protein